MAAVSVARVGVALLSRDVRRLLLAAAGAAFPGGGGDRVHHRHAAEFGARVRREHSEHGIVARGGRKSGSAGVLDPARSAGVHATGRFGFIVWFAVVGARWHCVG